MYMYVHYTCMYMYLYMFQCCVVWGLLPMVIKLLVMVEKFRDRLSQVMNIHGLFTPSRGGFMANVLFGVSSTHPNKFLELLHSTVSIYGWETNSYKAKACRVSAVCCLQCKVDGPHVCKRQLKITWTARQQRINV